MSESDEMLIFCDWLQDGFGGGKATDVAIVTGLKPGNA